MDILTEIALFVGGFWLVRDLQLSWRKKSVVVIAYGLRLPVVLAAAVRLYYLHQSLYSDDESLHGILASVCTQTELAYAVIATTMPCLKPFMSALNTGYGGGGTFVLSTTSPNSSNLQRSRDTAGGSSTYGKAKAAAVAVMSGAAGGSNGGASAGSRSASKVRKSSDSQARILGAEDNKSNNNSQGGNGTDSDGQLSRPVTNNTAPPPPMPKLAPSQTQYIPTQKPSKSSSGFKATKTTNITAAKNPFGGRSRISGQAPDFVAVTTDISVHEEKESEPASPASPTSPITPASPIYAHFSGGGGRERIGNAE